MKRACLSRLKGIAILFIVATFVFHAPELICQDGEGRVQALKSFRITPKATSGYTWVGAVYNPNLDLYIVFYEEFTYESGKPTQRIFSLPLNRTGKKAGSAYPVRATQGYEHYFPEKNIALNVEENEILFVWNNNAYNEIGGIALNGVGHLIISGGAVKPVTIMSSSLSGAGSVPKAAWIPSKNLYAVAWSHYDRSSYSSQDNGFYLAVLNKALKRKLKPTKVKQQSIKNRSYTVTTLLPVEDRLLWGAAQDSAKKIKPVAWFTDFQGEVIAGPNTKRDGSIYPGKKVKGEGDVFAEYNPYYGQYLLMWNAADRAYFADQTFRDTFYRIMNSDGSFLFKKRKMPKKTRFHTAITPVFNPVTNNFFVAYVEHKIFFQGTPFRAYYGAKIWATYIDSYGNIGIPDSPGQKAFPLTDTITDKSTATLINQVIYNPLHNEYLVVFSLFSTETIFTIDSEIWGIVLK